MYLLTYGGEVLHDPRADLEVAACSCTLEVNSAGSLEFAIAPSHPLFGRIREMDPSAEVVLEEDGEELFRGRVLRSSAGMRRRGEFACEGQLAYLNDTVVRPYGTYASPDDPPKWERVAPGNVREYAEWLVGQHNAQDPSKAFDVSYSSLPTSPLTRSSTVYPSTGSEVKEKLLDHGWYVRAAYRDGRRLVEFSEDGWEDAPQAIEFGANLLDYASEDDFSRVVSAIVPVGEGGLGVSAAPDGPYGGGASVLGDMMVDDAACARYGLIVEKRGYEAATLDGLLAACARDLAAAAPVRSLSVTAADLSHVSPGARPIRVGSWVRVESAPHGVLCRMMCMRAKIDVNDPRRTEYELGALPPDAVDANRAAAARSRAESALAVEAAEALSAEARAAASRAETAQEAAIEARDAAAGTLTAAIEASGGLALRGGSTVLRAVAFRAGERIAGAEALAAALGPGARVLWTRRRGTGAWGAVPAAMLREGGTAVEVAFAGLGGESESYMAEVTV